MNDEVHNKSEEHSLFFFQLVNKHLPSDDGHEDERSLGIKEYIHWMVGIIAGFIILRSIVSLLFM